MSNARSVFTEAIEDHLALKKQNIALDQSMPLARYDVGDPLDRYPGGPNRAEGTVVVTDVDAPVEEQGFDQSTQVLVGPSPEQAMEAATALEHGFADRPFEPLAPMLSLVEDIDEAEEAPAASAQPAAPASADVLRFPGGVGPREDSTDAPDEEPAFGTEEPSVDGDVEMHAFTMPQQSVVADAAMSAPASFEVDGFEHDAPTGEQPVLVIDADEPLAADWQEPAAPVRSKRGKPRFFGLGRKKDGEKAQGDGWFTDGPRDFNWD